MLRLTLFAGMLFIALVPQARAQTTYTWDGGSTATVPPATGISTDNNWTTAANWNPDVAPVPAVDATILLDGIIRTATVNNYAAPFILNGLQMGDNATSGFSITGSSFQFAGSGANITRSSALVSGAFTINSGINFAVATILDAGATNSTIYEIVLNGAITGGGTVNKTGADVLIASRNNTFTGTFNAGASNFTAFGAVNALGRAAKLSTGTSAISSVRSFTNASSGPGQSYTDVGYSQQLGALSGAGSYNLGGNDAQAASLLFGFLDTSTALSSSLSSSSLLSHAGKVGIGTFTYSGSQASSAAPTGGLSVRDGAFNFTAGGRYTNTFGTAGDIGVYAGATLNLNNSATVVPDRLPDSAVLRLAGGIFALTGNASANVSETLAGLVLNSGQSKIVVGQGTLGGAIVTGRANQLVFASVSQNSPTATVFFAATNLGNDDVTTGSAVGSVTFAASPVLVGGTLGTTAAAIVPFGLGAIDAAATAPTGFVTYTGTGTGTGGTSRIRILADAEYASTISGSTTGDNVKLSASETIVTAGTVRNSLLVTAPIVQNFAGSFTLTSGALMATATGITQLGGGPIEFGTAGAGTAYITVADPAGTLTVATTGTAANFSKDGAGTISLQNAITLGASPTVGVNAGTLQMLGGTFTPASGTLTYQVSKGATLAVVGADLAVAANRVLTGAGTVTAPNLVVSGGGLVRPSSLATLGQTGPAVLTVPNTNFGPGGTYEWYVSSVQGGQYTQSEILSTGSLNITSTTMNKFNIKVTPLSLANVPGGPVYDADNATHSWTIAHFDGGIGGNVSASSFNLIYNQSDFAGANLSISMTSTDVILTMIPVPEPGSILAIGALGLIGVRRIRRFRKKA
jgi:hypothetical protein